ncbi:hypothetical protein acdb102_42100 [Acidothermaceae bacterium B102]|nr:hypothetical protein acdb102_42100 [Acidothermaceae bacterium B102]
MLTEQEFRDELHRRLGDRLDDVRAPASLVDHLRTRQAGRTALLRSSSAVASVAVVGGIVAGAAFWQHPGSRLPSPPAPAASAGTSSRVPLSTSPAPNPSTPVIDLSGVAPLVTSGPCAGLAIAVYRDAPVEHPPVTALTSAGLVLRLAGPQSVAFKAGGPCVDRLSFVQRTATFANLVDVPYSFPDGEGFVDPEGSPQNQTGVVQFFLDCKGFVCSGSGAPLATLTIHVPGSAPGAASLPFEPVPSPFPLPPGPIVTIPSVIGMSPDAAMRALQDAGLSVGVSNGRGSTGTVTSQDPPAGSVVPKGSGDDILVSGGQPFTRPPAPSAPAGVAPPSVAATAAQPSLPSDPTGDVPFIRWPQRGELVNTTAALDAEAAWDAAKGPHHNLRIVYAGSVDGMVGVILEGDLRMALLVRATPGAPFTVLDDRFVRQNGGLRELSALGRPLLKDGTTAPYQIAFAVVHPGDVVSVTSPGLQRPATPSYAGLARVPLSATRADTSLRITGGSTTVNVPLDPSSG